MSGCSVETMGSVVSPSTDRNILETSYLPGYRVMPDRLAAFPAGEEAEVPRQCVT